MGLVQKAFSDIITFSRSSNATRIGPNGLVQYAPHNLLLQSQTLDNASWTKSSVTVTANAAAAPDGTVTADQVAATSTTVYLTQSVGSLAVGQYTISVYLKSGTTSWAALTLSDSVANANGRYFDLSSVAVGGSTGLAVGSNVTVVSASATNIGNGWVRCAVTLNVNSATTYTFVLQVVDGNNSTSVTSGKTFFAWGAQLAVGSNALDYVPTTSAAVYGPRFDYDPVTLAAKGLLIEEQRSNSLTYSEQFDNAAWTTSNGTLTANAAASPDGTISADQITTSANNSAITRAVSISADSTTYTASIFVKYISGSTGFRLRAALTGGTSVARIIRVNAQTGAFVASDTTYSIVDFGNGWYRVSMSISNNSTNTTFNYQIYPTDDSTSTNVLLLWGAQLEAGSFATSYIPTLASSVTRSADVASVNMLSPWFNVTEMTVFLEASVLSLSGPDYMWPYCLQSATPVNSFGLFKEPNLGNIYAISRNATSGVNQSFLGPFTITANTVLKSAFAGKSGSNAFSVNGLTALTDSATSMSNFNTMSQLMIGNGDQKWNGHIRRIAYYPRRLTNAELQALSA